MGIRHITNTASPLFYKQLHVSVFEKSYFIIVLQKISSTRQFEIMTKTLLNNTESLFFLVRKSLSCFENIKNTVKVRVSKRTEELSFH